MANKERAEVELSYKQTLFPGNIKKNFQHRYFIQRRSGSSCSDDSTFDLADTAMSLSNAPSQERSIPDLPSNSSSKSISFQIESVNAIEDNDVFMESSLKVLTHKRSAHGSQEFSKMSFTQQGHPLTTKCFGSEHSTTKQQVHRVERLPSQKHSWSKIAIGTKEQERHGLQNTKPQLSNLHHHLPGFLLPQFVSSAKSIPFHSVQEGCHMFFNFNKSTPFAGFISDPELSTPSPGISTGIHFEFPPRARMYNSMSELNRMAMSPLGCFPNQNINMSQIPSKHSTLKQNRDQRRALSDSDAYKCPVCNQMFLSFDNLAKHMAKHLPTETILQGENNKVHLCKVCNRSFSRSDMLTRHMRLHTGIKPYECSDCGQVFSRSDHLNTHKRIHTGEKPYRCPQCPYAACRRDMVTRHMRTHNKRSVKRDKLLSVPYFKDDLRMNSVSRTDTTGSQDISGRTCSQSSIESVDIDC
ncbi:unnamed protein product [Mytilus coruscus]|uniref:C2H2-type domain-containing protein n=1 Tax=Mytilus coruscus TaxID=42192 RepID=A0A6J8AEY7_MYTCO|nr:unnamed protein product [Mytilus coruscus]